MSNQSQKGGIIGSLLGGLLLALIAVLIVGTFITRNVRVQHRMTSRGDSVSIETPLGAVNVNAGDHLNPESIGVPVYPGAERKNDKHGGVQFDLDTHDGIRKNLTISGASYSTPDSSDRVVEFYRSHLPNWTISEKNGRNIEFHFSENGYKRIIGISERNGQTHIGIASFGEPGVN
jgi:hypothetical protein